MRFVIVLLLGCLTFAIQPAHAKDHTISPTALIGTWTRSGERPDGKLLTIDVNFFQNDKFSGSAKVQGDELWRFSGTWEVVSGQLVWLYDNTSLPLPDTVKTDTDDIVSVSHDALVLVSRLSGNTLVYSRKATW